MLVAESETVMMVFDGEYDLAAKAQLRSAFDLLAVCRQAILDFSSVTYIDSTVLCEMARMHQARSARGYDRATLILNNASVLKLLGIASMTELFRIVATREDAVRGDGRALVVCNASSLAAR